MIDFDAGESFSVGDVRAPQEKIETSGHLGLRTSLVIKLPASIITGSMRKLLSMLEVIFSRTKHKRIRAEVSKISGLKFMSLTSLWDREVTL